MSGLRNHPFNLFDQHNKGIEIATCLTLKK